MERNYVSQLALELVVGLGLTRSQLEGLRWAMAYRLVNGKFRRRRLKCMEHQCVPCLSGWQVVAKEKTRIANLYGITDHGTGTTLPTQNVVSLAKRKGLNWKLNGMYHIQFLADAFSHYRHSSICNFGIRLLSGDDKCRNLTNVCCLGEIICLRVNLFVFIIPLVIIPSSEKYILFPNTCKCG